MEKRYRLAYLQLVLAGLSLRGGVEKIDGENLKTKEVSMDVVRGCVDVRVVVRMRCGKVRSLFRRCALRRATVDSAGEDWAHEP